MVIDKVSLSFHAGYPYVYSYVYLFLHMLLCKYALWLFFLWNLPPHVGCKLGESKTPVIPLFLYSILANATHSFTTLSATHSVIIKLDWHILKLQVDFGLQRKQKTLESLFVMSLSLPSAYPWIPCCSSNPSSSTLLCLHSTQQDWLLRYNQINGYFSNHSLPI